jgi:hypothetical protein
MSSFEKKPSTTWSSLGGLVDPVRRLRMPLSSVFARSLKIPAIASLMAEAMTLRRKNRNESPTTTSMIGQFITMPLRGRLR